MDYEIRYLPYANIDIIETEFNLSRSSPSKAKRFMTLLYKQLLAARHMPRMYREYEDMPPYRIMNVLDYVVFYTIDDEARRIDVHRVLWGGRDLPDHLKNQSPCDSSTGGSA